MSTTLAPGRLRYPFSNARRSTLSPRTANVLLPNFILLSYSSYTSFRISSAYLFTFTLKVGSLLEIYFFKFKVLYLYALRLTGLLNPAFTSDSHLRVPVFYFLIFKNHFLKAQIFRRCGNKHCSST